MSRIGKIARRSFLVGSAAIAGGVAFGIYKVRTPYANPLKKGLATGAATFNPWVLIDGGGITLITPHADLGQGIASAQAALIAEEMDLDFTGFEISFGRPDKAYWNRAMANDAVPFMATDHGWTAETMRGVMGGAMKLLGVQATGGSSAIPDSFQKLREAGAVARETLKLAAAHETGVPVDRLRTEGGAVHLPDGRALAYTALAATAAGLEPVSGVTLRDPATWRLVGKPMRRLDTLAKSTGTQDYGIDLSFEGMVHAAVRMSPRRSALVSFDATEARGRRGVRDVFAIKSGVAVIADNSWRAIRAAEAVACEWAEAPYPAETEGHYSQIDASFTGERLDSTWRDDGDVEAALAAGKVVKARYRSPYVAHQPLEPLNATVRVTDSAVDVWSGHQIPIMLTEIVGAITGHAPHKVRFHNLFTGGSFGHRLEFAHLQQAAEIANRLRGTPVKLTYSREEDFTHDFARPPAIARASGTTRDGHVEAIDLAVAMPSVVASQMGRAGLSIPGPDVQIAAGSWNNPYALDHYRMRAYRVPELAPVSSWRSVGAVANGFFFDSFLDELIHAAGADPMAERIRLMGDPIGRKVLETVAEMSAWGRDPGPGKGRGVAFVESFGVPCAEVVEVSDTAGGIRIDKVWVAADVGTVVDPVNFENLVQGGVVFALGHAMNSQITFADGMVEQENYWDAEGMRLSQCPEIEVRGLEIGARVRGIGEPPVPPAAPALANAIFAATGKRLREMPFSRHVDFA